MNDFLKDFKYDQNKVVQGVNNSFLALYILTYYNKFNENVIILTSNMYQANTIYKAIGYKNENILLFPMDEFVSSVALSISPDFRIKRLEVLDKLKSSEKKYIIVTSLMGYLKYLPCTGEEQSFDLTPLPQNISREIIIKKLDDYGYNRVSFVATTGEYAVRHYIIDIFPVGYDHPVRLEFFDEELETIKFFDENSQITYDTTDKIQIKRFIEQESSTHSSLADYIDNQTLFIVNAEQIKISYNNLLNQQKDYCCSKELL